MYRLRSLVTTGSLLLIGSALLALIPPNADAVTCHALVLNPARSGALAGRGAAIIAPLAGRSAKAPEHDKGPRPNITTEQ